MQYGTWYLASATNILIPSSSVDTITQLGAPVEHSSKMSCTLIVIVLLMVAGIAHVVHIELQPEGLYGPAAAAIGECASSVSAGRQPNSTRTEYVDDLAAACLPRSVHVRAVKYIEIIKE